MMWNPLAVLAGLAIGMAVNMALITLNSRVLFPMPEGTSMQDPEQFQAYVSKLPAHAFVVVMAAHLGQAFFGGWAAAFFGRSQPVLLAMIVGGISMVGGVMMLRAVKGPRWMVLEVPLYLVVAYGAGLLVEGARVAT